jgi:hypothetical protein
MQTLGRRTPRLAPECFSACALLALAVLAGGCQRNAAPPGGGSAAPPHAQPTGGAEPKPPAFEATGGIDPKVITAWEQAGATFGWEVPEYGGDSGETLLETEFVPARPKDAPCLPAFSAAKKGLRGLSALSAPGAPFALNLHGSPLTEADLEALAGFRHLRSLSLVATQLRDSSLSAVGGLRQVEVLKLGDRAAGEVCPGRRSPGRPPKTAGLSGAVGLARRSMDDFASPVDGCGIEHE